MRFRQQSFQQRCFLLPLISDWMMVFIINTLIFQTVIKIHLCFQPFHVHGSFQRHVYLQKGTPMAVLFKFQPKKKAIVTGIVLLERFSQESSWNYAWVCVFVWMVDTVWGCWQCMCCYGSTKLCGFCSFVRWRNGYLLENHGQGRFVLFVSEGSSQKNRSRSLITSR